MGRGNQLFRVCARLRFKTGGKRIGRAFQDPAGRSQRAFAVFQPAAPVCACVPLHELFCSSNKIKELYMGLANYGDTRFPLSQTSISAAKANIHHGGTEKSDEEKEFLIAAIFSSSLYNV